MFAVVLQVVAVVLAGLTAGIYLAFSAGVMPGLARTPDTVFTPAMRWINRGVLNPAFLVPILLSPFALGGAALATGLAGGAPLPVGLLTAAAAVGLVGSVLITGAVSVPLNVALDAGAASDTEVRRAFERPWNRGNLARTLLTTLALVLAVAALAI